MDRLAGLSLGRKLALAGGVLLFIDTFLTWQKVSVKLGGVTVVSATATAWHGFWGVFLGLLTIAFVLWVAARAFGVELPVALPDGLTTLGLGVLTLFFAIMKTVTESYSAWGSYVGIVLAAVAGYGSWLIFQESGEALPSMPASSSSPPSGGGSDTPSNPSGGDTA